MSATRAMLADGLVPVVGMSTEVAEQLQAICRHDASVQSKLANCCKLLERWGVAQDVEALNEVARLTEPRSAEREPALPRVCGLAELLVVQLKQDASRSALVDDQFVAEFLRAITLHDIGNVYLPDDLLLKPARLESGEFEIMKLHTVLGGHLLLQAAERFPNAAYLSMAAEIARAHHERWDGLGYPDGRRGEEIPLPARIFAVVDVYDALTSDRPYERAFPAWMAQQMIADGADKQFDPAIVDVFLACCNKFAGDASELPVWAVGIQGADEASLRAMFTDT